MKESIEIPEEISDNSTPRYEEPQDEGPPIDNDIEEDIPLTESQEWK